MKDALEKFFKKNFPMLPDRVIHDFVKKMNRELMAAGQRTWKERYNED